MCDPVDGQSLADKFQRWFVRHADKHDVGNALHAIVRRNRKRRVVGLHNLMFDGDVLTDEDVDVVLLRLAAVNLGHAIILRAKGVDVNPTALFARF